MNLAEEEKLINSCGKILSRIPNNFFCGAATLWQRFNRTSNQLTE